MTRAGVGGDPAQLGSSAGAWGPTGEGVLWVWCMGEATNVDFMPKMPPWDKGLGQAPAGSPWWRKGCAWCSPACSCLHACSIPAGQAGGTGSREQGLAPGWVMHGQGCPWGKGWTPGCSLHRDVPPGAGFLRFPMASAEAGSGPYAATCTGRMGTWEYGGQAGAVWGRAGWGGGKGRAAEDAVPASGPTTGKAWIQGAVGSRGTATKG